MADAVSILATPDSRDPIARMRVYQLAAQLLVDAWPDAMELSHHPMTIGVSDQLYSAVGSIEARIADGYSRSSGKDRSRFFEYALSSVRESVTWYRAARPILGIEVTTKRWETLEGDSPFAIDDYSARTRPQHQARRRLGIAVTLNPQ